MLKINGFGQHVLTSHRSMEEDLTECEKYKGELYFVLFMFIGLCSSYKNRFAKLFQPVVSFENLPVTFLVI